MCSRSQKICDRQHDEQPDHDGVEQRPRKGLFSTSPVSLVLRVRETNRAGTHCSFCRVHTEKRKRVKTHPCKSRRHPDDGGPMHGMDASNEGARAREKVPAREGKRMAGPSSGERPRNSPYRPRIALWNVHKIVGIGDVAELHQTFVDIERLRPDFYRTQLPITAIQRIESFLEKIDFGLHLQIGDGRHPSPRVVALRILDDEPQCRMRIVMIVFEYANAESIADRRSDARQSGDIRRRLHGMTTEQKSHPSHRRGGTK